MLQNLLCGLRLGHIAYCDCRRGALCCAPPPDDHTETAPSDQCVLGGGLIQQIAIEEGKLGPLCSELVGNFPEMEISMNTARFTTQENGSTLTPVLDVSVGPNSHGSKVTATVEMDVEAPLEVNDYIGIKPGKIRGPMKIIAVNSTLANCPFVNTNSTLLDFLKPHLTNYVNLKLGCEFKRLMPSPTHVPVKQNSTIKTKNHNGWVAVNVVGPDDKH
ncbi:uncharacterized protein LOC134612323 [Pelobates fuscus]|uniref:uncharacterized protein LOC134612323 n=1 Tax=Pelobates fuscus TaxID=191477 RepID=UPI002FE4505C